MFFDMTYVYYVLPAVIFSLWASMRVKSTFAKYSQVRAASGLTGAQVAERILRTNGVLDVRVEQVAGNLTDHYDPKAGVIRLSENVYGNSSIAAIGVAAHEAGHALQYAQGYGPIKFRAAIIPITSFGSKMAFPLVLLGILLNGVSQNFIAVAYGGLILFGACVVFQLATLPVEVNASKRALAIIDGQGLLRGEEYTGARKMLTAAAMTYVAALAVALMQFYRLFLIIRRSDRN